MPNYIDEFYDGVWWDRKRVAGAQRQRAEANAAAMGWQIRTMDLLSEPLEQGFIDEFEAAFGVQLPADYRSFLLQVGDGGVGPGLFMRPLGSPFDDGVAWEPGTIASDRSFKSLHKTFPHIAAVEGGYDAAWLARAGDDDVGWEPPGALQLWDHGCAIWGLLVLSGPVAGQVWIDSRTDGNGLKPQIGDSGQPMTFAGYYCQWLMAGDS